MFGLTQTKREKVQRRAEELQSLKKSDIVARPSNFCPQFVQQEIGAKERNLAGVSDVP